jgi:large subunit ribosomal protein L1
MGHRSKRYLKEAEQVSQTPISLADAVEKVKSFKSVKFDQSVNCVVNLGIDTKLADQNVRGSISLPHGIGKQKKVIVFCDDADVEMVKAAGAIEAGIDDLVKKINEGWMDFDVAIASPKVMGKVGKLGKVLGPQGKMPSPKNGTVTADIVTAVKEFAAGKIEFKNDAGGNVQTIVGKQSFEKDKLIANIEAFLGYIRRIKPATVKGTYIKRICISATMSPAVFVSE